MFHRRGAGRTANRTWIRSASVLLLGLTLGCQRAPNPAAQPQPPSPLSSSAAAPTAPTALTADQRLAMQPAGGSAPVDRIITELQKRSRANPDKVDHWIGLGRAWVRKARESADPGYYLNADACATVALGMEPDNLAALNLRGLVLLNDHRFAEAQALAERTLAKQPRDPMALGTLSDALMEQGRYEAAVDAAQRMVDLKPALPSYARGSYLAWLRGDVKVAKQLIRMGIDATPMSKADPEPRAWALTQAANLFWHEADYDGADAGYKMALELFPDYPPALVGRGRVEQSRGQYAEAAKLFEKAYQGSPLVETAWLWGDARSAAGDAAGAGAAYDLVMKRGKRSDPRTLALFLAVQDRDHDEALRLAQDERKTRGDIYTLEALAMALYRAGRVPEARIEIDAALKLGTLDARVMYHGGLIHLAAGDKAAGQALLRRALKTNAGFDARGAAEAKKLLGGK